MIPTFPDDSLREWLAAEREEDATKAEAALFRLMTALPDRAPPAGFADRVLAGMSIRALPNRARLPERFRYFAAAALLFAGVGVAAVVRVLSSWLAPVVDSAVPAPEGISLLGTAISLAARLFTDGLLLWQGAIGFRRGFHAVLDTPEAALSALTAFLVCAGASYALRQVLARERKIHVGF